MSDLATLYRLRRLPVSDRAALEADITRLQAILTNPTTA